MKIGAFLVMFCLILTLFIPEIRSVASTSGDVSLTPGYNFECASGDFVTWSQTIYMDYLNYSSNVVNFTNAALETVSNSTQTFAIGCNQGNSTIFGISDSEISTHGIGNETFYYSGSIPSSVLINSSIYTSSQYETSFSLFKVLTGGAVFLNTTGSYLLVSGAKTTTEIDFVLIGTSTTQGPGQGNGSSPTIQTTCSLYYCVNNSTSSSTSTLPQITSTGNLPAIIVVILIFCFVVFEFTRKRKGSSGKLTGNSGSTNKGDKLSGGKKSNRKLR